MKRITTILAGLALLAPTAAATAQTRAAAVAQGARVWSAHCTRCHTPRPSAERTDREWQTIVAHMRARANLTRSDAAAVALFLQMTNAPPAAVETDEDEGADPGPVGAGDRTPMPTALSPAERVALLRYLAGLRPR